MIGYRSTRGGDETVEVGAAIGRGLAPDGGLYIPTDFPRLDTQARVGAQTLTEVAVSVLSPFFAQDPLAAALPALSADAFGFPIPLRRLDDSLSLLELFHGPTAAFKDVGARFLAGCHALNRAADGKARLILVATSGDTGSAVAAAYHRRDGIEVAVLYPEGRVSARQEQQLCCWGDNVRAFRVAGAFDDCQRIVKAAFSDPALAKKYRLSSANSINIGRLLPQMCYYAWAAISVWRRTGERAGFVIPSGNLGNALACLYARACGLPIGPVVLATNANRPLVDLIEQRRWQPRPSVATLASAMDVGNPSNVERLRALDPEGRYEDLRAVSVDDDAIQAQIRTSFRERNLVVCPHTATALHVYAGLTAQARAERPWVLVATAHPAKFEGTVEPLIGADVELPPSLARLLAQPGHSEPIEADLSALVARLGPC